jgi:hypothetical protein
MTIKAVRIPLIDVGAMGLSLTGVGFDIRATTNDATKTEFVMTEVEKGIAVRVFDRNGIGWSITGSKSS